MSGKATASGEEAPGSTSKFKTLLNSLCFSDPIQRKDTATNILSNKTMLTIETDSETTVTINDVATNLAQAILQQKLAVFFYNMGIIPTCISEALLMKCAEPKGDGEAALNTAEQSLFDFVLGNTDKLITYQETLTGFGEVVNQKTADEYLTQVMSLFDFGSTTINLEAEINTMIDKNGVNFGFPSTSEINDVLPVRWGKNGGVLQYAKEQYKTEENFINALRTVLINNLPCNDSNPKLPMDVNKTVFDRLQTDAVVSAFVAKLDGKDNQMTMKLAFDAESVQNVCIFCTKKQEGQASKTNFDIQSILYFERDENDRMRESIIGKLQIKPNAASNTIYKLKTVYSQPLKTYKTTFYWPIVKSTILFNPNDSGVEVVPDDFIDDLLHAVESKKHGTVRFLPPRKTVAMLTSDIDIDLYYWGRNQPNHERFKYCNATFPSEEGVCSFSTCVTAGSRMQEKKERPDDHIVMNQITLVGDVLPAVETLVDSYNYKHRPQLSHLSTTKEAKELTLVFDNDTTFTYNAETCIGGIVVPAYYTYCGTKPAQDLNFTGKKEGTTDGGVHLLDAENKTKLTFDTDAGIVTQHNSETDSMPNLQKWFESVDFTQEELKKILNTAQMVQSSFLNEAKARNQLYFVNFLEGTSEEFNETFGIFIDGMDPLITDQSSNVLHIDQTETFLTEKTPICGVALMYADCRRLGGLAFDQHSFFIRKIYAYLQYHTLMYFAVLKNQCENLTKLFEEMKSHNIVDDEVKDLITKFYERLVARLKPLSPKEMYGSNQTIDLAKFLEGTELSLERLADADEESATQLILSTFFRSAELHNTFDVHEKAFMKFITEGRTEFIQRKIAQKQIKDKTTMIFSETKAIPKIEDFNFNAIAEEEATIEDAAMTGATVFSKQTSKIVKGKRNSKTTRTGNGAGARKPKKGIAAAERAAAAVKAAADQAAAEAKAAEEAAAALLAAARSNNLPGSDEDEPDAFDTKDDDLPNNNDEKTSPAAAAPAAAASAAAPPTFMVTSSTKWSNFGTWLKLNGYNFDGPGRNQLTYSYTNHNQETKIFKDIKCVVYCVFCNFYLVTRFKFCFYFYHALTN